MAKVVEKKDEKVEAHEKGNKKGRVQEMIDELAVNGVDLNTGRDQQLLIEILTALAK